MILILCVRHYEIVSKDPSEKSDETAEVSGPSQVLRGRVRG